MNKQKFLHILHDYKSVKETDLSKINELRKSYPYSQVVHIISAIATHKLKTDDASQHLTMAAVYSTDLSVLKEVVLSSTVDEYAAAAKKSTPETKVKKKTVESILPDKSISGKKEDAISGDVQPDVAEKKVIIDQPSGHPGTLSKIEAKKLREEVMMNLEKLLEIKHRFLEDYPMIPVKKKLKKNSKSGKERKKPLFEVTKSHTTHTQKKSATLQKKSEISVSAGKKKTEDRRSKKNEQQEIIEKFLKASPKIKRNTGKVKKKDLDDLSAQSVEFGDNLVSENLARVMIKQGNKSKAIDIYKKLIWKFPQKKAYFASQIDSLKEK